jgi:hypothetical protein
MKYLLTTLIYLGLFLLTIWAVGCVQIIHEKTPTGTRLKINTLFKEVTSDGLYYDPNGFMQVDDYTGIPSDIVLEYDPITNSFKFKAEK